MAIEPLSNPAGTVTSPVSAQSRPALRDGPAPRSLPGAPAMDAAQARRVAETINRQIETAAKNLRFSVDDSTGKTIVRVVDTSTGEVIRQVPSEELLAISRSIDRLQGLLFHQQA